MCICAQVDYAPTKELLVVEFCWSFVRESTAGAVIMCFSSEQKQKKNTPNILQTSCATRALRDFRRDGLTLPSFALWMSRRPYLSLPLSTNIQPVQRNELFKNVAERTFWVNINNTPLGDAKEFENGTKAKSTTLEWLSQHEWFHSRRGAG